MSKKSKSKSYKARRVTPVNATPWRARHSPPSRRLSLALFEDRRTFHPVAAQRPARSFSHPRHRLVAASVPQNRPYQRMTAPVAFQAPRRVLVCVRRRIRKQVIHAFGHAGRTGQKRPRRNEYSTINCKD